MVFVALAWWAASAALSGCVKRSVGGVDDGGRGGDGGGCEAGCPTPYVCDEQSGECVCPPETCCVMVDCWCLPGERHCEGDDLVRCEWREVWQEDGMCGSICEYPLIRHCQQGCVEETYGDARCGEEPDPCGQYGTGTFTVTMFLPGADEYSCQTVSSGYPELDLEANGVVTEIRNDGFVVQTTDWMADITHNLPPYSMEDLWPGRHIRVRARWTDEGGWYCTQRLSVHGDGDRLILYAQDGDVMLFDTVPFTLTLHDLGCVFPPDGWCEPPATYAMNFLFENGEAVRVHQGETGFVDDGPYYYEVTNLRSYASGLCDDYWNYAFFVSSGTIATTGFR